MQLSSLRETLSLNQYEVASFYFHTLVCFDVWYIQQLLNVLLLSQQTLNPLCEAREEVANLIYNLLLTLREPASNQGSLLMCPPVSTIQLLIHFLKFVSEKRLSWTLLHGFSFFYLHFFLSKMQKFLQLFFHA